MVRVGGGWDELEHFLSRHNPNKLGKRLICEYFTFLCNSVDVPHIGPQHILSLLRIDKRNIWSMVTIPYN